MFWTTAIAIAVIVGAATSLFGWWHTRRDIKSGRPSYLSLADLTGIWDRDALTRICGPPDHRDRYKVTPEMIARMPIRLWVRVFDTAALDLVSATGAVTALWLAYHEQPGHGWLLATCAGYQLLSWALCTWFTVRHASPSQSTS